MPHLLALPLLLLLPVPMELGAAVTRSPPASTWSAFEDPRDQQTTGRDKQGSQVGEPGRSASSSRC
ncbi:hypothetical protein BS78_03G236300 [Paspalum vaginatum]|nr:hypothetical protein BS78_03G236300 [Paspalum vaginatum]